MSWSISVKTVGNTSSVNPSPPSSSSSSSSSNNNSNGANTDNNSNTKEQPRDFTVQVEPNDVMSSLHRKIEAITGLKSSQQRLIYRGRLISSGCDSTNTNANANANASANTNSSATTSTTPPATADGTATAAAAAEGSATTASATGMSSTENFIRNGDESTSSSSFVSNSNNGTSASTSSSSSNNTLSSTTETHNNNNNNTNNTTSNNKAKNGESRICDVVGLSDGQTIHLVPRPCSNNDHNNNSNTTSNSSNGSRSGSNSNDNDNNNNNSANNNNNNSSSISSSGAGVLAALLGLGSSNSNNNNNNNSNGNEETSPADELEAALSLPRVRNSSNNNNTSSSNNNNSSSNRNSSSSSGGTTRRRYTNSHRRSEDDPLHPSPCPLEPVRQGLMTLHTMIGEENNDCDKNDEKYCSSSTSNNSNYNNNNSRCRYGKYHGNNHSSSSSSSNSQSPNPNPSPLNFKRKWYRGQWIDCRDTVNQWLEATIVEIVSPEDIIISVPKKSPPPCETFDSENAGANACASKNTGLDVVEKEHDNDNGNEHAQNSNPNTTNNIIQPYTDPAIGASDLDGRTKLLLEPTEDQNDTSLAEINDDERLIGYRERQYNDHVQLLKIHYNGWPHRWDEWIRSDSERIRPFRTRSRHVPNRNYVSPSPQSVFHASPRTAIREEEDGIGERLEILPELYRVMDTVQELFEGAVQFQQQSGRRKGGGGGNNNSSSENFNNDDDDDVAIMSLSKEQQVELSEALKVLRPEKLEGVMNILQGPNDCGKSMDVADIIVEDLDVQTQSKLFQFLLQPTVAQAGTDDNAGDDNDDNNDDTPDTLLPWRETLDNDDSSSNNPSVFDDSDEQRNTDNDERTERKLKEINKKKLEALAPLLDRLGRVLMDFAPHVATIAESMPDRPPTPPSPPQEDVKEALRLEAAGQEGDGGCDSRDGDEFDREDAESDSDTGRTASLRPLWSTSRDAPELTPLLSPNAANSNSSSRDEEQAQIDPDYVDFVNGFINNTVRMDSPPSRRSTRRSNSDSFGSSLLSAFLASTAGGSNSNDDGDGDGPRIVRLGGGGTGGIGGGGGGNGSGGIDIHIHAIVTGPGGAGMTGAAGLDGLMGGLMSPPTTTTTTTPLPSTNSTTIAPTATRSASAVDDDDEDDLGLFSDLYAEGNGTTDTPNIPFDTEVEIEDDQQGGTDDNMPDLLDNNEVRGMMSESMDSIPQQDTNTQRPSSRGSTSSNSSRRGQMLGRIFRRALRSNRRNNDVNNNN